MLPSLFIVTTIAAIVLFFRASGNNRQVAVFFSGWAVVIAWLSWKGFFLHTTAWPPRMLVVLVPAIIAVVYFYRLLRRRQVSAQRFLWVHVVRIPVEYVLYRLFLESMVPRSMTFAGWNLDIFSGISALLICLYLLLCRKTLSSIFFLIWNLTGIVLLAIIVITAILSAPSPIQILAFEQPNRAILMFPYTLLPAIVVPLVLLSHLLALQKKGISHT